MNIKNFINENYIYIYFLLCTIIGYLIAYFDYKKGYWPFNKKDE